MDKFIAFCGLNCEECDAYKPTMTNDWELRKKVSEKWAKLNGLRLEPEFINCQGCRQNGIKSPFCQNICRIRQCALEKHMETCADCDEKEDCRKLKMITDHNSKVKNILGLTI